MNYAHSYQELEVYQLCRQLAKEIFEISKKFPKEEKYSLTDQIRRSSRAVGSQIAEAWAKRRYERHWVSKLSDADGEQEETVHWLMTASDCLYLAGDVQNDLLERYGSVHRMLESMQNKASSFCQVH